MNIQTVADNLRNTIAGKVKHLAEQQMNRHSEDAYVRTAAFTVEKMLEINLTELKRILQDVEQCVEEFEVLKDDLAETNGRVRQLERHASDDSWITNPDRMGGQFSQDEIDNVNRW